MIDISLDFLELLGLFLAAASQFFQRMMVKDSLSPWQRAARTSFLNSVVYTLIWSALSHDRLACVAVVLGCWSATPLTYLLEKR